MKQLIRVWNRGYNARTFLANDADEALRLAVETRHIRRERNYRKFEDVTEAELALGASNLQALLSGHKCGIVAKECSAVWRFEDDEQELNIE